MSQEQPQLIVLAGPNGAGKSTIAPELLSELLDIRHFVNADSIAVGLSAFQPGDVAVQAGRVMLARLRELAAQRADFAFETTLASRSFAPWIQSLRGNGYAAHLYFMSLSTVDQAVARVGERVRRGGHDVLESTIRRRFSRGLRNFFSLYRPVATTWRFFSNDDASGPRLIAEGRGTMETLVSDPAAWLVWKQAWM